MHAIYETGSRLTHDVKNLLQSLRSLCCGGREQRRSRRPGPARPAARQLPQIAQRLQTTLDKLGRGAEAARSTVPAGQWWRELQGRYAHEHIEFESDPLPADLQIPADLFDRVAENCLQNALEKRRRRETNRIEAALRCDSAGCRLMVTDAGSPIPEAMVRQFFTAPVPSDTGLGVGLYQSARHASELGYVLRLDVNSQGSVRFVLEATNLAQTAAA